MLHENAVIRNLVDVSTFSVNNVIVSEYDCEHVFGCINNNKCDFFEELINTTQELENKL